MSGRDDYIEFLENICGKRSSSLLIDDESGSASTELFVFANVPELHQQTVFTYGLSMVSKKEWVHSRPELVLAVASLDEGWPRTLGEAVSRGRSHSLFEYGLVLRMGRPISKESAMSNFLLFAPNILDEPDCVCVLADYRIRLTQAYPVFDSEIGTIKSIGPEKFVFRSEIDFYDPARHPYA